MVITLETAAVNVVSVTVSILRHIIVPDRYIIVCTMKDLILASVIVIIAAHCIAICNASCACLNLPQKDLKSYHKYCTQASHSRNSNCVAAINNYCNAIKFPWFGPSTRLMGVSREVISNVIGISCIATVSTTNVNINHLSKFHMGCNNVAKAQSSDCTAAIHRYCQNTLNDSYAGLSQHVPSTSVLQIACFEPPLKVSVPHSALKAKHSGCYFGNSGTSTGPDCFSAASRYCVDRGYDGGITQEVNQSIVVVACYNAVYSGDRPISNT